MIARLDVIRALESENIEGRSVWKPMHLQPLFAGCQYFSHAEGVSVSDLLFATGVCLPSGSSLTEEEQQRVIECIKRCF
ncbi:MAG TPA: DegT/DnrJ/EryC1/StrS family aminotransferase [Syntrophothermus lipocalidus]|nr:DegT/DnrJ/EryC1/StrS family aminotransferase [Syntrophothermus lipocalidus]